WADLLESAELQTVDLYPVHSQANVTRWLIYCHCQYSDSCKSSELDVTRTSWTDRPLLEINSGTTAADWDYHQTDVGKQSDLPHLETVSDVEATPLDTELPSFVTESNIYRVKRRILVSGEQAISPARTTESSEVIVFQDNEAVNTEKKVLDTEKSASQLPITVITLHDQAEQTIIDPLTPESSSSSESTGNSKPEIVMKLIEPQSIDVSQEEISSVEEPVRVQLLVPRSPEKTQQKHDERKSMSEAIETDEKLEPLTTTGPAEETESNIKESYVLDESSTEQPKYVESIFNGELKPNKSVIKNIESYLFSDFRVSSPKMPMFNHSTLRLNQSETVQQMLDSLRMLCHPKCPQIHGTRYCWGPELNQCQATCSFSEIETVKGIDYLRRSSLRAMENCTTFHGDIKLSRQSFVGDPFHNITRADEGVRWSDLVQGLSGLREVTGILYISAGSDAPWLNNLTFLSKLEVIGGGGKSASCARQCVTEMGCWGPGPFFCRECRHWSVPRLDGTRLCVDQCEHVPGYFTPSMSNAHAYVPTPSTTTPVPIGESARAPDDPIRTESQSTITANVSCGTCSVNCRLENNACYGPGSDQCILPCRWVKTCPSDTYLHVVNLHYRGGSSTRSLAVVHTMNSWRSQSRMHHGTSLPWSHTDAVLFERFPREVQLQLASWLHNHTQPKLYGVARVCLPCHEQCARDPTGAKENKSSVFVSARASICLGPGPEQCMRCANASYMGR
ncbi:Receptor protein-tyrosine kinase, partial [Fasciola gigantica]